MTYNIKGLCDCLQSNLEIESVESFDCGFNTTESPGLGVMKHTGIGTENVAAEPQRYVLLK